LDIGYTFSVADQIAGVLPPLSAYMGHFEEGQGLLAGFEAEYFDTASLQWEPTQATDKRGLYRTQTFDGMQFANCDAAFKWRRPVMEIGMFEVLRWEEKSVLNYSAESAELRVPPQIPLPALHARAASLCSGRLPRIRGKKGKGHELVYDNISESVANRISRSLHQTFLEASADA
jgi:hypothetical protein